MKHSTSRTLNRRILSFVLAVTTTTASAQVGETNHSPLVNSTVILQRPSLGSPTRVELKTPAEGRVWGTLLAIDEASVTIVTSRGERIRTPVEEIRSLRVSEGAHRNTLKGAVVGGVVGFLAFAVAGSVGNSDEKAYGIVYGMFLGAPMGAGTGAVLGFLHRSDRWTDVPLVQILLPEPVPGSESDPTFMGPKARPSSPDVQASSAPIDLLESSDHDHLRWQVAPMLSRTDRGAGLRLSLAW